MAELLETVMLICFGCSWPISLIKNIKAKSAKNTSLGFILLILMGYAGGISAKVLTHNYSFVLVAYIINVVIVLANLVVYFINRKHDRNIEQYTKSNCSSVEYKQTSYRQAA